ARGAALAPARGRPGRPRRHRARAAARGAPAGQRAPARRHDRAPEVGARRLRARRRGGDVEGQAGRRRLRGRTRAADHHQRDRLHRPLRRGRRVSHSPPAQQPGAHSANGRRRPRARAPLAPDHPRARRRACARRAPDDMSAVAVGPELPPDVERQVDGLATAELAVGVLTYNNAATVPAVVEAVRGGLEKHFTGARAVLINADAGSSDATVDRLADSGLPFVRARHEAPAAQLGAVPFHGVPGRGAALRLAIAVARRLGARALLVLEADVTSITGDWLERPLRPVPDGGAALMTPTHARHRSAGTTPTLVRAPLVGSLFGRRLHQPLSGPRALSARALERLGTEPRWPDSGRSTTDLWIAGTAIAEG